MNESMTTLNPVNGEGFLLTQAHELRTGLLCSKAFMSIFFRFPVALVTAFSFFLGFLSLERVEASLISFNTVGRTTGGMVLTDTAGAPGAVAANWNNMNSSIEDAVGTISGTLSAGTILDSNGTALASTAATWSGEGWFATGGSGTDDRKMWESEWDLFSGGTPGPPTDMTITVTGIPYDQYDVYFYVQDGNNAQDRGGDVIANGITKSIMMYNFAADNPAGSFGYTEADNPFTYTVPGTTRGSYLSVEKLSGDLTLEIESQSSFSRLRMSGFQIVQVIPEPSTSLMLLGMVCGAFFNRRKRNLSSRSRIG